MNPENCMLYRLPRLIEDKCPICMGQITKKEAYILLRNYQNIPFQFCLYGIPFCVQCNVYYANNSLLRKIQYEKNLHPELFYSRKLAYIINETRRVPKDLQKKAKKFEDLGFEVVEECTIPKFANIEIIQNATVRFCCPACRSKANKRQIQIPISVSHQVVLKGYGCTSCKRFYTAEDKRKINLVFEHNPFTAQYRFDENNSYGCIDLFEKARLADEAFKREQAEAKKALAYRKKREKLKIEYGRYAEEHPETAVILNVLFQNDEEKTIYIVNNHNNFETYKDKYDYTSPTGLEYLSAAFATERNRRGRINENEFVVRDAFEFVENESYGDKLLREPSYINIGKGGGTYTSVFEDPDCVMADILLYSPFTKRFELLRSTYNKRKDLYYTDIRFFREFIYKYGKPNHIDLEFPLNTNNARITDWKRLSTESFLYNYGYNVNNSDFPYGK